MSKLTRPQVETLNVSFEGAVHANQTSRPMEPQGALPLSVEPEELNAKLPSPLMAGAPEHSSAPWAAAPEAR